MKNILIKNDERDNQRNIRLNNGSLIVQYNGEDKAINVFMVTSFRSNERKGGTGSSCSLINLDTGYLAFEEPSDRNTTEFRILRLLNNCCYSSGLYDDSKISDRYIRVFDTGDYLLEIDLKRESTKGR